RKPEKLNRKKLPANAHEDSNLPIIKEASEDCMAQLVGQNHQPLNDPKTGKPDGGALKKRFAPAPHLHKSNRPKKDRNQRQDEVIPMIQALMARRAISFEATEWEPLLRELLTF